MIIGLYFLFFGNANEHFLSLGGAGGRDGGLGLLGEQDDMLGGGEDIGRAGGGREGELRGHGLRGGGSRFAGDIVLNFGDEAQRGQHRDDQQDAHQDTCPGQFVTGG